MVDFINKALNFIFPPICGFCDELNDSYLCDYCKDYLKGISNNKKELIQDKFFDELFYIFEYNEEIRSKIIAYKFKDKSYLYRTFCEFILENKEVCDYIKSFDIIMPVPIHKKRQNVRGYNQSELICKSIVKSFLKSKSNKESIEKSNIFEGQDMVDNIKINPEFRNNIIKKVKNIAPQSSLDFEARLKNVCNAYKFNEQLKESDCIKGKRILIFDDVYTTGSTVNECSKILKDNECEIVGILVLAKNC